MQAAKYIGLSAAAWAAAMALVCAASTMAAGQDSAADYLRPMNGPEAVQDNSRRAQERKTEAYQPAAGEPPSTLTPAPGARRERSGGDATVMRENTPAPIDKGDLAPIMSGDGSNLPMDLWNGMDIASFEKLLSEIAIPPRSAALHDV